MLAQEKIKMKKNKNKNSKITAPVAPASKSK